MSSADLREARWRTSSYSGGGNEGNCVELARTPAVATSCDSKAPALPTDVSQ